MAQEVEMRAATVPTSELPGCGNPTGSLCKRLEHHLVRTGAPCVLAAILVGVVYPTLSEFPG